MAHCEGHYRPDRFFKFATGPNNSTDHDCTLPEKAHATLLALWIVVFTACICYMILYTRAQQQQKKKNAMAMKNLLLLAFLTFCICGLVFCILSLALAASFSVNGTGAGFVAFWTAWTGITQSFGMCCALTIVVVVQGASAGDRFDAVKKGFKGAIKLGLKITYCMMAFCSCCNVYFWAICPHHVELHEREACWQNGCITTGIFFIFAAVNAFLFVYKLIYLLKKLMLFSAEKSTSGSNCKRMKTLQGTINRLTLFQAVIPPAAISGVSVYIAMGTVLPGAWWTFHLLMLNATSLMEVVLFMLFVIPKKNRVATSEVGTVASSMGSVNGGSRGNSNAQTASSVGGMDSSTISTSATSATSSAITSSTFVTSFD